MKMKRKRKLWLGLALLLMCLQTGCGSAAFEEDAGQPVAWENAGQTAVWENAGQETVPKERRLETADKAEGALPPQEEEEISLPEADRDEERLGGHETEQEVTEDGSYTGKDEVALYLHLFGHLPDNYITKKEARALGWDSSSGNLWEVAPGKSIGGDYFGNYEGLLPEEDDRDYFECDIDYEGGRRNAKRMIYSDDGLIFYTEDHYESFEQLY